MIGSKFQIFLIMANIVLSGCAHNLAGPFSLELNNKSIILNPTVGIDKIKLKVTSVESEKAGHYAIQNRFQYRKDLFKQSQDPYFGAYRWSTFCLQNNEGEKPVEIDSPVENTKAFGFKTKATIDQNFNSDLCRDDSLAAYQIIQYCPKQKIIVEIVATGNRATNIELLCPDKIFLK